MAEAVAAVSLVASIVSLVDFGSKIASRIKEFKSRTTSLPASFQNLADQLPLLNQVLEKIRIRASVGGLNEADASTILPVVESTLSYVRSLYDILKKTLLKGNSSSLDRIVIALKSLAHDDEIVRLLDKIRGNVQLLVFAQSIDHSDIHDHVIRILSQIDAFPRSTNLAPSQYSQGLNLGNAPLIERDYFIGRTAELAWLEAHLTPRCSPPSQQIVSIAGMGGLGKTQLSLAYARSRFSLYSAVFWFNAKDEPSLKQSLADVCDIISHERGVVSLSADEKIAYLRRWLSEENNSRWLLLFDNYDNPQLAKNTDPEAYDIRRYLPHREHGNILITTRSTGLIYTKQLKLKILDDSEHSLDILTTRSGRAIRDGKNDKHSLDVRHSDYPRPRIQATGRPTWWPATCSGNCWRIPQTKR